MILYITTVKIDARILFYTIEEGAVNHKLIRVDRKNNQIRISKKVIMTNLPITNDQKKENSKPIPLFFEYSGSFLCWCLEFDH